MDRYQTNKLIDAVFLYLNGERISLVQATIAALSTENEKDAKELYKAIPITLKLKQKLLEVLRVPKAQQKFYANQSHLFGLLTHLHQDGYGSGHLGHLLTLINDSKYNFYRRLRQAAFFSVILGGIGSFAYFKPEYMARIAAFIANRLPTLIFDWMKKTFSLLKNLTFIGLAMTCFRYLLFLYNTFYNGFSNLKQKLTAVFFRTSAVALNLGAYAIIFSAAGMATPISAFLFISSSFIGVIESLARYLMIRYQPAPKDKEITNPWLVKADSIREKHQRSFALKEMVLRISFALLMTGLITAWCMVPGSIFITLGFMAATMLVGWLESLTVSKLEARHAIKLQKVLQEASEAQPLATEKEVRAVPQPPLVAAKQQATLNPAPTASSRDQRFFKPADKKEASGSASLHETLTPQLI